jgi:hypothetical protein
VLSIEEGAGIVAFCKYTLLPLDDCLYALRATVSDPWQHSNGNCLIQAAT